MEWGFFSSLSCCHDDWPHFSFLDRKLITSQYTMGTGSIWTCPSCALMWVARFSLQVTGVRGHPVVHNLLYLFFSARDHCFLIVSIIALVSLKSARDTCAIAFCTQTCPCMSYPHRLDAGGHDLHQDHQLASQKLSLLLSICHKNTSGIS